MNRRNLLTAAAASLGLPGTVIASNARGPDTHPDAELMQTCAAFDALERIYVATGGGHEIGSLAEAVAEAEQDRISEAQRELVTRMCDLRAATREGMAARAHSLALWDAELLKDGDGDAGTRLTAAIVRDLLAGRTVA